MSKISIVVPVYHNAASLPDLLSAFQELAEKNTGDVFEFVFVDDGSKDNSFEVLQALVQQDKRVNIAKLSRNFGSNPAIQAGLSLASGDAIVAIAADLQDPPELIHDMLTHWRNGKKVILAAREGRDDPMLSAFMANSFYTLFRRFAIKTMPKQGFDFFLIDKKVCNLINHVEEHNVYLMGLILWLGFDPHIIYYRRRAREKHYGKSMWSFAKKFKYFLDSFVAFSYLPIRLSSIMGVLLSFLGLIYAIFIIISHLFFGIEAEGWSSLMVVTLIIGGTQMLMMGILGEYVWRNLDETRKRPPFIIEDIIRNNTIDSNND